MVNWVRDPLSGSLCLHDKHYAKGGSPPRTGKEVYTEWRDPSGKITKDNIDEPASPHRPKTNTRSKDNAQISEQSQ
ncbi:hypothetical protein BH10CYA1_BH10CYA1_27830 [soil metagenome]